MAVATIDIGTNTVLLLVADRLSDGSVGALAERATVTRLGAGVDRARVLSSEAVARTKACLEDYARVIGSLRPARIAVVGTSAMRDAGGGQELRAVVRALFGTDVRVLSGAEEARLTFQGGLSGLDEMTGSETAALFDIGGGSTEVVLGRRSEAGEVLVDFAASFNVGSVRLTERLVASDPPSGAELAAISELCDQTFRGVPALASERPPVGVAGTMTTLAAVTLGLTTYDGARVHGCRLRREELSQVVGHLAAMNLQSRRLTPGIEPKRADVIIAGGLIALSLLSHWGAVDIFVSDRGLRWGLAEELLKTDEGQRT